MFNLTPGSRKYWLDTTAVVVEIKTSLLFLQQATKEIIQHLRLQVRVTKIEGPFMN